MEDLLGWRYSFILLRPAGDYRTLIIGEVGTVTSMSQQQTPELYARRRVFEDTSMYDASPPSSDVILVGRFICERVRRLWRRIQPLGWWI